jgi:iron complex outermembrane receptor protein
MFLMRLIKRQVNKMLIVIYLLSFCFLTFNVGAQASKKINEKYQFDIPVQSLSQSLNDLSDVAKISFLFPYDLVENKKGSSVKGDYTVQQALTMLLNNSGLEGERSDKKAFLIKRLSPNATNNESLEITQMKTQKTILASIFTMLFSTVSGAQETEKKDMVNDTAEVEVITVTGVRGSLQKSMNDKRFASEIKDTISAEDIGQLPDENIAEALQRVTGVQMTRSDTGEGSTIQIRGISNNNVEINGQVAAGTGADRSVNFQDIPSELFSGIEVLKAPTANKIEGSLGGTVNLKTHRPLSLNKDQIGAVTAKAKYNDLSGETDPDFNAFFAKNFRDTSFGDFGLILNLGKKEISSQSDNFGDGGSDSPAAWLRRTGDQTPAGNTNNNLFKNSGPFEYDTNIDVNGDGLSNADDVFYIPNEIRVYSGLTVSERDSFNGTLQWQPSDNVEFFLDVTHTESEEEKIGSQAKISLNGGRTYPIIAGSYTPVAIGGGAYVLDNALIGAANMRLGGAPSIQSISRESDKITFGGEYKISDDLQVSSEFNTSKGTSKTNQAQLNMGLDWDRNGNMNAIQWHGVVGYSFDGNRLPSATFYESPFHPADGVLPPSNASDLVPLDITNMDYDRLNYFQMQRRGSDTESKDDSFKLDLNYDLSGDFFTTVSAGIRVSERSFERISHFNNNQKSDVISNGLVESVRIQAINVNPEANADPANAHIAADFQQQCFDTASIELNESNLPTSWVSTTCDSDYFTQYFGMHDIRAFSTEKNAGLYEQTGARYDVTEETKAAYVRADFMTEIAGLSLFGNVGLRYVATDTTSGGLLQNTEGSFDDISLEGNYQEALPSLNLNMELNDEMLLRFAGYKALSRPGLAQLSPGIATTRNDNIDGFAGVARLGNPNLTPVIANNFDLSYEWYYSASSLFSAAVFYKDLDSTIATSPEIIDVELNNEMWKATQPANLAGTKITGYEVALQHSFDGLEGFLSHTGVGANYTYTEEDSDLLDQEGDQITRRGLSENSYNLMAFYDDDTWSVRLAYNWRDDFVRRENVTLGYARPELSPEIEKARGQLDLTANYTYSDNLKIIFSAINLNDSETVRFMKYKELTNFIGQTGKRFNLGAIYRF